MSVPTKMKKKYETLFRRYNVVLRPTNSRVFHPAYVTTTEVTPLQFALYECAIKAIDAHYQALIRMRYVVGIAPDVVVSSPNGGITSPSGSQWLESYKDTRRHHATIADRDGFTLLELEIDPPQAYEDHRYCCDELGDLYLVLLD